MRNRYGGDPYWMRNRFAAICACGKAIEPNERVFYYPNGKRMLCSICGDKAELAFQSAKQDEAFECGGVR